MADETTNLIFEIEMGSAPVDKSVLCYLSLVAETDQVHHPQEIGAQLPISLPSVLCQLSYDAPSSAVLGEMIDLKINLHWSTLLPIQFQLPSELNYSFATTDWMIQGKQKGSVKQTTSTLSCRICPIQMGNLNLPKLEFSNLHRDIEVLFFKTTLKSNWAKLQ